VKPGARTSPYPTYTSGRFGSHVVGVAEQIIEPLLSRALRFGNDHAAGPSNWLSFTAGTSDQAHGLFGFLTPADKSAPEATGDDR